MARRLALEDEALLLLLINEAGVLGRYRLGGMLSVPLGVVRGMLGVLEDKGFVKAAARKGSSLTAKGRARLDKLLASFKISAVRRLNSPMAGTGPENMIFHVRGASARVKMGVEQRDAAIKAGADGAITLVYDGRTFRFPGVKERPRDSDLEILREVSRDLKPKRSDTFVVAFGSNWWHATRGGLLACATLRG